MDSKSYRTQYLNKDSIQKNWFVADADGKTLGRFSSEIAKVLRGKNKASFTPHLDCGDYVIVINSDNIKLTGNKWKDKKYVSHSGYPGGQKITSPAQIKERKSSKFIVEKAVKGMLPKNRLGRQLFRNLFVYEDNNHPHEGQKPKELKV
ncbi:MAG: 50S ribosomal protein L13 [Cytophagia bacterium]|nr:50S ribosomal protein L13 [Cytophagia bacterium]|tara:strand:+ start:261 stop:707 length:447 start_codon:yes stop_codon:yes gene_type:complete